MDLDLLFVGTGGSAPTARRGLPAILLTRGGEHVLVDCGEGTQRQLMRAGGLVDLDLVLITHLHADHWLGLPGLLKTYDLRERERPLELAGPPGLARAVADAERLFGRTRFGVRVRELEPGDELDRGTWGVEAVAVEHRTTAVGWAVVEDERPGRFDPDRARALGVTDPRDFGRLQAGETVGEVRPEQVMGETRLGRRVVITGDTRPCDGVLEAAWRADVLVHDGTFCDDHADRARQTGHSTVRQAAELAREAEVELLALVHLSARHRARDALAEARAVRPDALLPRDRDRLHVPYPERGAPELVPARRPGGDGALPGAAPDDRDVGDPADAPAGPRTADDVDDPDRTGAGDGVEAPGGDSARGTCDGVAATTGGAGTGARVAPRPPVR